MKLHCLHTCSLSALDKIVNRVDNHKQLKRIGKSIGLGQQSQCALYGFHGV